MLAPLSTAASRCAGRAGPLDPRLQAGDRQRAGRLQIDRVSSKMSLIAAQISSFDTRTISSTVACTIGNVMLADLADGDAVGEDADADRARRGRPAASDWYIASASNGSTPMTRTSGRSALM